MKTVKETVECLNESFAEFKSAQEQRLDEIEQKGVSQTGMEEKLKKIEDEIESTQERLNRVEIKQQRPQLGDVLVSSQDNEHKSSFMAYVTKGDESSLLNLEAKSLSVASDPDGGYLVPDVLNIEIGRLLEDSSTMRRLARSIRISTDAVELLVDRGDAEAGWVAETAERGETTAPKLVKLKIPVHELYAKPRATQKLLDDAKVDVEGWLAKKIAQKFTKLENQAFLTGDGANKPKGLLNYELKFDGAEWGKLQAFKTGVDGAFGNQNAADILIDMVSAMKPELLSGAVWLMSRSAHAAVRKLKDSQGQYLWQPGIDQDARPKLLGYPVEVTDDMPALTKDTVSSSIVFGNFKEGYQIVERAGVRVLRDPYSVKPYVEFYTTCRIGGDVVNFDAFKVLSFTH